MKRFGLGLVAFATLCATFVLAQTPPAEFKGHDGLVYAIAFSTDGKMLATASFDGTVKLWDFATGKEKSVLKGHTGPVYGVAFNKDNSIVATCSFDKTIRYWSPADGKFIKELKGHTENVSAIAFSPDGALLASCSSDKSVRLWDKDGKEVKNLGSHKESAYSVAFNKDGTLLASCGNDGVIKVWDIKGQKEVKSLMVDIPKKEVKEEKKPDEPKEVKDKKKDDKKKNPPKKEEVKELRDAFTVVAFTPDSKHVISGGHDKILRIWDIGSGKDEKKFPATPDYIFGLALTGDKIATAGYGGSIRVYDLASGKEIGSKNNKASITYCIAFTPDGKSVVTGHDVKGKGVAKVTPIADLKESSSDPKKK